jgi:hypothetical protein
LFRLGQAFAKVDTELLLGEAISPEKPDDAVGGRWIVSLRWGQACFEARAVKSLIWHHRSSRYHLQSVYGIMTSMERIHDQPFRSVGFSKAHRPDLKQLVHSLLCVDAGIPIYSRCENGNESDKVVNRNLIPTMVERMAELGRDNFLYVADSALITEDNLALMDDWKSGFRFVSRLPATYKECGNAITKAVRQDSWRWAQHRQPSRSSANLRTTTV